MLKLQASCMPSATDVSQAGNDVVAAADECCHVYSDMIAAGIECKEIEDVFHDVVFIKEHIKAQGLRTFHYRFDKDNKFAAMVQKNGGTLTPYEPGMGLAYTSQLQTEYIEAATESLKVWWTKFIEALKNLWSKFVTWVKTTLTFRDHYINKIKDLMKDFGDPDFEKKIEGMSADDCDDCMYVVNDIHEAVRKITPSMKIKDLNKLVAEDAKDMAKSERYKKIGITVTIETQDDNITHLTSIEDDIAEKCKLESKTIKELGFDSKNTIEIFCKDLINLESKSNFKDNVKKMQDLYKKLIEDFEKGLPELIKAGDDSKESKDKAEAEQDKARIAIIRSVNSSLRACNKMVAIENKLVVRCAKTAIKLLESGKKK